MSGMALWGLFLVLALFPGACGEWAAKARDAYDKKLAALREPRP